ncbi:cell division protein ZapA [Rhodobacter sp. Har01]|uniref:cell division protein ZapA n=1 Tax=Rhodobacter sp. Har01 TaxID=2883999 RepID=UPI001D07F56F|nr:cell division protein ZapA [Rhodobacter sp. Har01]MCB6177320.1 cell division protein ZapA [Rhodobacter sp. Har01]
MPELEITVGGRPFLVSCQPGEEHFLRAAAQLLDNEAQPLLASMGRVPEAKMLLMAGLMLADKVAATDDELRQLRTRVAELEGRPAPEAQRVEVPVIPPQVPETLAEIAAWAESLADRLDERRRA